MSIANEFPHFPPMPEANQLLSAGWTDESWHNDVCPRLHSPDDTVAIWIDHPVAAERDFGDGAPRFVAVPIIEGDLANDAPIYAGDNFKEALAAIAAHGGKPSTVATPDAIMRLSAAEVGALRRLLASVTDDLGRVDYEDEADLGLLEAIQSRLPIPI